MVQVPNQRQFASLTANSAQQNSASCASCSCACGLPGVCSCTNCSGACGGQCKCSSTCSQCGQCSAFPTDGPSVIQVR